MKTKTFIEKVEALDFVGKAEKGISGLIGFPNKNGEALISVNEDLAYHFTTDYKAFRQLHLRDKKQLANIAWEYASTPLVEREEEKEYVYRMNRAVAVQEYLKASKRGVVRFEGDRDFSTNEPYFKSKFTDAEVENYPEEVRELFKICEKIEVSE